MKNKDKFIENLNILDGVVSYNGFDIDKDIPFADQWYNYTEDILQIKYGDRFLLDVGWYPEHDPKGKFSIVAVVDQDWMNPLLKTKCSTLDELKKAIEDTAAFINEEKKKNLPCRNIEYENFD